ncbi:signal peptidase I [Nocardioides lijunqiniae]|uniref:signal peptidase I n=1 Tax=Nocardioides lijunqiniae TaxID=2760832 RepID=UPI0018780E35|nr:signal peptidase I [Nocardioides lijunqiniae]
MEIAPAPARRTLSGRALMLLVLAVIGPVTLLALLPTTLGLERYVVATGAMDGGIDRGSVVLERVVPVSDLEVGDVITYRPPRSADVDELVTRRIVRIDGALLQTQGDALADPDPWLVPVAEAALPRVVLAIPYAGYPFLGSAPREAWWAMVAPGALLGFLALRGVVRRRPRRAAVRPGGPILGWGPR